MENSEGGSPHSLFYSYHNFPFLVPEVGRAERLSVEREGEQFACFGRVAFGKSCLLLQLTAREDVISVPFIAMRAAGENSSKCNLTCKQAVLQCGVNRTILLWCQSEYEEINRFLKGQSLLFSAVYAQARRLQRVHSAPRLRLQYYPHLAAASKLSRV